MLAITLVPIRPREWMMSPTYFAVRNAQLDEQFKAAQLADDMPWMEEIVAEQNLLHRAMYG
jgi:hypothetical protein